MRPSRPNTVWQVFLQYTWWSIRNEWMEVGTLKISNDVEGYYPKGQACGKRDGFFFFFYESCSFDSKQIGRGRSWVKIKLQIQPLPSHRRLPSTQGFPQFVIRWENKARGLANLQWRLSPWHAFWNDWKPKIKRQPWQHCHFMTIFTHLGQWSKDGNVIGKADQVGVSWGSFLRTVAWDMNYMDNFFCL